MVEIKLDAHIVDGKIEIAEDQRQELSNIKNGSPVEVILRANEMQTNQRGPDHRDILREIPNVAMIRLLNISWTIHFTLKTSPL